MEIYFTKLNKIINNTTSDKAFYTLEDLKDKTITKNRYYYHSILKKIS